MGQINEKMGKPYEEPVRQINYSGRVLENKLRYSIFMPLVSKSTNMEKYSLLNILKALQYQECITTVDCEKNNFENFQHIFPCVNTLSKLILKVFFFFCLLCCCFSFVLCVGVGECWSGCV